MKNLRKTGTLTIRISPDQRAKLGRAARVESQRKGETVDESTLARELMMAGVDSILARELVEAT